MATGSRRRSRELALQMLFQFDLSGNSADSIVASFDDLLSAKLAVRQYAEKLFRGTVERIEEIDEVISQQADNWRVSRMAVVDRNIIRVSIYELFHEPETPRLVVIDEAIEIAKKFGTEKSSQFINGVLDGILKRYNLEGASR